LGRLQSTKACADSDCGLVEFVAVSLPPVSIDLEPIASEAGKDVQVDVENLLEGSFTVGEKQVYAFALQPRPTQRPPQPVGTFHTCIPTSSSRSCSPTACALGTTSR
jgi:hypothetical protein